MSSWHLGLGQHLLLFWFQMRFVTLWSIWQSIKPENGVSSILWNFCIFSHVTVESQTAALRNRWSRQDEFMRWPDECSMITMSSITVAIPSSWTGEQAGWFVNKYFNIVKGFWEVFATWDYSCGNHSMCDIQMQLIFQEVISGLFGVKTPSFKFLWRISCESCGEDEFENGNSSGKVSNWRMCQSVRAALFLSLCVSLWVVTALFSTVSSLCVFLTFSLLSLFSPQLSMLILTLSPT